MVRAKFFCDKNESFVPAGETTPLHNVTLRAVYEGSPENKEFWKWTPGGAIQLSTINPAAAEYFIQGREYYVDFLDASKNIPPKE